MCFLLAHFDVTITSSASHRLLGRLSPLQTLVHPRLDSPVATRADAIAGHALEHLAGEADKVVTAERILEAPLAALALLPLQQLRIAKLARAHAQVAAHGQQVEADLGGLVASDTALQHVDHAARKLVLRARAVRDGRWLQPVELVQRPADRGVGDKVEGVLGLGVGVALRLVGKRVAAREAVVHLANQVRVAQRLAAELGRQHHGEVAKVAQLLANVDLVAVVVGGGVGVGVARLVQQHTEQRLRGARILYRLRGEEELFRGGLIEFTVEGPVGCGVWLVGWVFEEKDDTVDGLQRKQLRRVQGEELFKLNVPDAEIFYQRGEYALSAC